MGVVEETWYMDWMQMLPLSLFCVCGWVCLFRLDRFLAPSPKNGVFPSCCALVCLYVCPVESVYCVSFFLSAALHTSTGYVPTVPPHN